MNKSVLILTMVGAGFTTASLAQEAGIQPALTGAGVVTASDATLANGTYPDGLLGNSNPGFGTSTGAGLGKNPTTQGQGVIRRFEGHLAQFLGDGRPCVCFESRAGENETQISDRTGSEKRGRIAARRRHDRPSSEPPPTGLARIARGY
jgi:hypothetical protein